MRTVVKLVLIALISLTQFSCSYQNTLTPDYELHWWEGEGITLSHTEPTKGYRLGVINGPLIAYINHANYIAVIRREKSGSIESESYFLIPFTNKVSEDFQKNRIGPMSKKRYLKLMQDRGLDHSVDFKYID